MHAPEVRGAPAPGLALLLKRSTPIVLRKQCRILVPVVIPPLHAPCGARGSERAALWSTEDCADYSGRMHDSCDTRFIKKVQAR